MIKIENTAVFGWEAAIRGMRNPMNSWVKSDTEFNEYLEDVDGDGTYSKYVLMPGIGEKDLKLMKSLCKAGSDHRKFLRYINVTADVTAPLYWWKEYDTYKVGTVANSCSTMHKIAEKEFTLDDFSHEHLDSFSIMQLEYIKVYLNDMRNMFNCSVEAKKKDFWWQMIQLLPSSYNQQRTVRLNYEDLIGMYQDHKESNLDEWSNFRTWVEKLPGAKDLIDYIESTT